MMHVDAAVKRAKAILSDKLTADGIAFVERECLESLVAGYEAAVDDLAIIRECNDCTLSAESCPWLDGSIYAMTECTRRKRGPEPGGEGGK